MNSNCQLNLRTQFEYGKHRTKLFSRVSFVDFEKVNTSWATILLLISNKFKLANELLFHLKLTENQRFSDDLEVKRS